MINLPDLKMRPIFLIVFICFLLLSSRFAFAGAAIAQREQVMRQRQAQAQAQRAAQERAAQQTIAQQRVAQQAAVTQRALQGQAQNIAAQTAYQQRAYQQQALDTSNIRNLQQQTAQEYQRIIQAVPRFPGAPTPAQDKSTPAVFSSSGNRNRASRQTQVQQIAMKQKEQALEKFRIRQQSAPQIVWPAVENQLEADQEEASEILTLEDVWDELQFTSEIWADMIDFEPKVTTVEKFIEDFKMEGATIRKPAIYYVKVIDQMIEGSPAMLKRPFKDVVRFVAIVEYDYDNGNDRDTMARKLLGEESYQNNRRRLGIK